MSIQYLKRAAKSPESETATARKVVDEMPGEIARNGEQAVCDYAAKLDQWTGTIVITPKNTETRHRYNPSPLKRPSVSTTDRDRPLALSTPPSP